MGRKSNKRRKQKNLNNEYHNYQSVLTQQPQSPQEPQLFQEPRSSQPPKEPQADAKLHNNQETQAFQNPQISKTAQVFHQQLSPSENILYSTPKATDVDPPEQQNPTTITTETTLILHPSSINSLASKPSLRIKKPSKKFTIFTAISLCLVLIAGAFSFFSWYSKPENIIQGVISALVEPPYLTINGDTKITLNHPTLKSVNISSTQTLQGLPEQNQSIVTITPKDGSDGQKYGDAVFFLETALDEQANLYLKFKNLENSFNYIIENKHPILSPRVISTLSEQSNFTMDTIKNIDNKILKINRDETIAKSRSSEEISSINSSYDHIIEGAKNSQKLRSEFIRSFTKHPFLIHNSNQDFPEIDSMQKLELTINEKALTDFYKNLATNTNLSALLTHFDLITKNHIQSEYSLFLNAIKSSNPKQKPTDTLALQDVKIAFYVHKFSHKIEQIAIKANSKIGQISGKYSVITQTEKTPIKNLAEFQKDPSQTPNTLTVLGNLNLIMNLFLTSNSIKCPCPNPENKETPSQTENSKSNTAQTQIKPQSNPQTPIQQPSQNSAPKPRPQPIQNPVPDLNEENLNINIYP